MTIMELASVAESTHRASSSCYAPQSDYHHRFDGRYALGLPGAGAGPRTPLEESSGNIQFRATPPIAGVTNGSYGSQQQHDMESYIQSLRSEAQSRIPTPPIIPSQGPPSALYGPSPPPTASGPGSMMVMQRRRTGIYPAASLPASLYYTNPSLLLHNHPLCMSEGFAQYRKRQAEKEDISGQVWPDWLEAPFLDALLFLPHIGKKKFQLYVGNPKQFGRNQLIEEYLKIVYEIGLPPGVEPNSNHERKRKEVSSHIQVIKNFFKTNPNYHLIFTAKETKPTAARRSSAVSNRSAGAPTGKNGGAAENLNNHPVLAAMRQRRLPSVRPNYEYFAALLKVKDQVLVKPRRCWIFVAHHQYAVDPHEHVDEDGNPVETTYTARNKATGDELAHPEDFPYLRENLFQDSWQREERAQVNGALLHQYTKSLEQVESCSASEMSGLWSDDFPELSKRLDLAVEASVPEWDPAMANPHRCEILHYHVTLEMQRRSFPGRSDLYPWIQINLEQQSLVDHRWKVVTRIVRPKEFVRNGTDRTYDEFPAADMGVQPAHTPGCDGGASGRDCDCRRRRQVLNVPFPAKIMADMLSKCLEYPAHPLIGSTGADDGKEAHMGSKGRKKKLPTQMELVPQVAMCQEIYSCSADAYEAAKNNDPESDPKWKRRVMILWSFETIHSVQMKTEEKTKRKYESLVTAPSGKATWRFLSAIDPTSRHHQERTMVKGDPEAESCLPSIHSMSNAASRNMSISRDTIQSPAPNFQQQFTAGMSENLGTGWDAPTTRSSGIYTFTAPNNNTLTNSYHPGGQSMYPTGPGGLSILASQHHPNPHAGLQTPPPTSSLNGSFGHNFDNGSQPRTQDMRDQSISFMSVTSSDTDNYLATAAGRTYSTASNMYDDMVSGGDSSFNGWTANPTTMPALDTRLYAATATTNWHQPQYNHPAAAAGNRGVASLDWVPASEEGNIDPISSHPGKAESHSQPQAQAAQHMLSSSQGNNNNNNNNWPLKADEQHHHSPSSSSPGTRRESQDTTATTAAGSWGHVNGQSRVTPASDLGQEWDPIDQHQQQQQQQQQELKMSATTATGTAGDEQMYLFNPAAAEQQRSSLGSPMMIPRPHQQQQKRRRTWMDDDGGRAMKMARVDGGNEE